MRSPAAAIAATLATGVALSRMAPPVGPGPARGLRDVMSEVDHALPVVELPQVADQQMWAMVTSRLRHATDRSRSTDATRANGCGSVSSAADAPSVTTNAGPSARRGRADR